MKEIYLDYGGDDEKSSGQSRYLFYQILEQEVPPRVSRSYYSVIWEFLLVVASHSSGLLVYEDYSLRRSTGFATIVTLFPNVEVVHLLASAFTTNSKADLRAYSISETKSSKRELNDALFVK